MSQRKEETYARVYRDLQAVLENESDLIAKMATISCLLKHNFSHFYWVGFYIHRDGHLVVGPYQGTLGCLNIAFGRGVCGTAAVQRKTQVVADVHSWPNHITCDPKAKSEVVVPVIDMEDRLLAVLDVDSDMLHAFEDLDVHWLEKIINTFFRERNNS